MPPLVRGKPRRFEGAFHTPIVQQVQPLPLAPVTIQTPPVYSEEEGIGKSPGHRWPWHRFWESRAPSAYRRYTWPQRHVLPVGRREGRSTMTYLNTYLQGNRHAWPGAVGGIIEYPRTQTVTQLSRNRQELQNLMKSQRRK